MSKPVYQCAHHPAGVERACEIARSLIRAARGTHDTDHSAIQAVARHARLSPAVLRRFIQPSRRPKDISLSVWERLVEAYRRHLRQQLAELELEIARLEHLDPADRALLDLLDEAKSLVGQIETCTQARDD